MPSTRHKESDNDALVKINAEYLLDTHTFIWAVQEPERLGKTVRNIIEQRTTTLYLSSISAFEVTNKYRLGKLPGCEYLVTNFTQIAKQLGVADLPVSLAHAWYAGQFTWSHRDPFDRIIAAQASLESLVLISNDRVFQTLNSFDLLW